MLVIIGSSLKICQTINYQRHLEDQIKADYQLHLVQGKVNMLAIIVAVLHILGITQLEDQSFVLSTFLFNV